MKDINIVVENEHLEGNRDLLMTLFAQWTDKKLPEITFVSPDMDMYDILVLVDLFQSKGEAKKNWKRTGQSVPEGFSDFERVGKRKNRLTIWNPK